MQNCSRWPQNTRITGTSHIAVVDPGQTQGPARSLAMHVGPRRQNATLSIQAVQDASSGGLNAFTTVQGIAKEATRLPI